MARLAAARIADEKAESSTDLFGATACGGGKDGLVLAAGQGGLRPFRLNSRQPLADRLNLPDVVPLKTQGIICSRYVCHLGTKQVIGANVKRDMQNNKRCAGLVAGKSYRRR